MHDECSSAFALRRSISTQGKPDLVLNDRFLVPPDHVPTCFRKKLSNERAIQRWVRSTRVSIKRRKLIQVSYDYIGRWKYAKLVSYLHLLGSLLTGVHFLADYLSAELLTQSKFQAIETRFLPPNADCIHLTNPLSAENLNNRTHAAYPFFDPSTEPCLLSHSRTFVLPEPSNLVDRRINSTSPLLSACVVAVGVDRLIRNGRYLII